MHCDDFTPDRCRAPLAARSAHQPPAAAAGRPGRDDLALRRPRDAAARAPSRPPRPARRRRPTRRCWSTSSCPAAWTCSTRCARRRLRALRRPAPGAEGRPAGRAGRHGLRRAPGAGGGAQRRPEGPLRPRPAGLHPRHRLRQPGPLALQQPPLLGDRPDLDQPGARVAGALDRSPRRRPTTPSRRCRWTPACRRCCAAAATRSPRCSRPTTPSRGSPACGASGRTA